MTALNHPEFLRARPYLIAALERGPQEYSLIDVAKALDNHMAVLWTGDRSAMVTTVAQYGDELVVVVLLGGGDMAELLAKGMPRAEQWARDAGCVRAEIYEPTRDGWARVLGQHGWRKMDGGLEKIL